MTASKRRSRLGERHSRTLEAHRYQLDQRLLPALGRRRIAAITVDDVAELLHALRRLPHLFEDARHTQDIRTRMAASQFAGLLEPTTRAPGATVVKRR